MIKKLLILLFLAACAYIFYKNYMADTLEPFFKHNSGKVDFFGQQTTNYKVE